MLLTTETLIVEKPEEAEPEAAGATGTVTATDPLSPDPPAHHATVANLATVDVISDHHWVSRAVGSGRALAAAQEPIARHRTVPART